MSVGKIVQGARRRTGLTQRQLAVALGVCRSYISKIETGEELPGEDTLASLATHLDLTAEEQQVLLVQKLNVKQARLRVRQRNLSWLTLGPQGGPDVNYDLLDVLQETLLQLQCGVLTLQDLQALLRQKDGASLHGT
jgi:transcriptional regulator with XRE-family HTH domain